MYVVRVHVQLCMYVVHVQLCIYVVHVHVHVHVHCAIVHICCVCARASRGSYLESCLGGSQADDD